MFYVDLVENSKSVIAISQYNASNDRELSLNYGDSIRIIDDGSKNSDWCKGELNGKIGYFPSACVNFYNPKMNKSVTDKRTPLKHTIFKMFRSKKSANITVDDLDAVKSEKLLEDVRKTRPKPPGNISSKASVHLAKEKISHPIKVVKNDPKINNLKLYQEIVQSDNTVTIEKIDSSTVKKEDIFDNKKPKRVVHKTNSQKNLERNKSDSSPSSSDYPKKLLPSHIQEDKSSLVQKDAFTNDSFRNSEVGNENTINSSDDSDYDYLSPSISSKMSNALVERRHKFENNNNKKEGRALQSEHFYESLSDFQIYDFPTSNICINDLKSPQLHLTRIQEKLEKSKLNNDSKGEEDLDYDYPISQDEIDEYTKANLPLPKENIKHQSSDDLDYDYPVSIHSDEKLRNSKRKSKSIDELDKINNSNKANEKNVSLETQHESGDHLDYDYPVSKSEMPENLKKNAAEKSTSSEELQHYFSVNNSIDRYCTPNSKMNRNTNLAPNENKNDIKELQQIRPSSENFNLAIMKQVSKLQTLLLQQHQRFESEIAKLKYDINDIKNKRDCNCTCNNKK